MNTPKKGIHWTLSALAATALWSGFAMGQNPDAHYVTSKGGVVWGGTRGRRANSEELAQKIYFSVPDRPGKTLLWDGPKRLSDVQPSPDGRRIAFREHTFERNVARQKANFVTRGVDANGRERTDYHYEDSVLRVIGFDGVPQASLGRVRRYQWSPDGARLAYITGKYHEGGFSFIATGVYVYDIESETSTRIADSAYDIAWSPHDGAAYFLDFTEQGPLVRRWDPIDGLESTDWHGIYFSPNGRFVYRPAYEGIPFRLYRTSDNQDVTEESPFLRSDAMKHAYPSGWFPDGRLVIPSATTPRNIQYIYDPTNLQAIAVKGFPLAEAEPQSILVMDEQGLLRTETWSSFPVVDRP